MLQLKTAFIRQLSKELLCHMYRMWEKKDVDSWPTWSMLPKDLRDDIVFCLHNYSTHCSPSDHGYMQGETGTEYEEIYALYHEIHSLVSLLPESPIYR